MLKVLVTREIPEIGIDMLVDAGFNVTVRSDANPFSYEELKAEAQHFDALLITSKEKIDRKFLETNAHLKVISQFAAGYDNIDVAAATELGIPVGNTPQAMNNATSDIAFGLMIAVARDFFQQHKRIATNNYPDFKPRADLGIELQGKTLGIYGLGEIGFQMAKKCRAAYGMRIIYCNRKVNEKAATELGAEKLDFDDFLKAADIISIHSNLSPETLHRFDYEALKKMKRSAILINTARGKIIVEEDLIKALKENLIYGAGLDVSDPEPMSPTNPLLYMSHVCVLPHIGSATVEARNEMARLAAENLIRFIKENKMTFCVNVEALPGR
jgi:glyoxylate reductase